MRFFNTAGPVNPEWHYCVLPLTRIDLEAVLIEQRKYFVMKTRYDAGFFSGSEPGGWVYLNI